MIGIPGAIAILIIIAIIVAGVGIAIQQGIGDKIAPTAPNSTTIETGEYVEQ